jgi:hypothetical protein
MRGDKTSELIYRAASPYAVALHLLVHPELLRHLRGLLADPHVTSEAVIP